MLVLHIAHLCFLSTNCTKCAIWSRRTSDDRSDFLDFLALRWPRSDLPVAKFSNLESGFTCWALLCRPDSLSLFGIARLLLARLWPFADSELSPSGSKLASSGFRVGRVVTVLFLLVGNIRRESTAILICKNNVAWIEWNIWRGTQITAMYYCSARWWTVDVWLRALDEQNLATMGHQSSFMIDRIDPKIMPH